MNKDTKAAVENLTKTYNSLAQAAAGYINTLDPKDVAAALLKAKPDTAEYIALIHLNDLLNQKAVEEKPEVVES